MDSFWDVYPDAAAIEAFAKVRNKRGDEISSNIMWYIRFMFDPEHEYIHKIPNIRELAVTKEGENKEKKEKKSERERILTDFFKLKQTDLNSTLTKEAIHWYVEYWMPPTKRWLNHLEQRCMEGASVTENFKVNTIEDIDRAKESANAYLHFKKLLDEAKKNFDEEKRKKVSGYGGKSISALMDGSLFKDD